MLFFDNRKDGVLIFSQHNVILSINTGHVFERRNYMSEKASRSKEKIADAALGLFSQKGYDEVSVKDICALCGIPRSSFYLAFSGKADILAYKLQSVKDNFQQSMPDFICAQNDFERIWFLTDAYLKTAVAFGSEISKQYFILELKGTSGLFSLLEAFNDWLIQLTFNCQKQGIVRNKTDPALLVPMQLSIAKSHLFDWVCSNGAFPLRQTVRNSLEVFLDVSPEYRH